MPDDNGKIQELEARLDALIRAQADFHKEITLIKSELVRLRAQRTATQHDKPPEASREPVPHRPPIRTTPEPTIFSSYSVGSVPPRKTEYEDEPVLSSATSSSDPFSRFVSNYTENARADLEKFIGENLISKIGIVVLVLGVGIGAKYAIDNNLISPLARIVIGYILGFGLIGLAIKLKPNYHNFSAVLISGGIAIMYFLTYFAYSSYGLIPQMAAFALMAMFTAFTVAAALVYNRQVIAHIGLVGAYAVPFLLSDDSGNYLALFTYISLINIGILAVSIKRVWRPLFYTSSGFTWLIFYGWFITKYDSSRHFELALVFLGVFFAIFFATKVLQKVRSRELTENESTENLVSAIVTCGIFYAFCYSLAASATYSGRVWTFLTFVAVATMAVLAVSFRVYGRALLYLAVPFVWSIYGAWYSANYEPELTIYPAITFAIFYFSIFYFSILFYRLREKSFSLIEHTALVLANSFIFYGFGYSILNSSESLENYLGLYTAANAAVHLGVAYLIGKLSDEVVDVVQVLSILVLTFASIAIPVQFDGNLVTLIWTAEAALLFWFGRTRTVKLFERFSYPVMLLATASMFLDWGVAYWDSISSPTAIRPLANGDFITAIVFTAAFGFIHFVNRDDRYEPAIPVEFVRPVGVFAGGLALFVLYNAFRMEIGNYYHGWIIHASRDVWDKSAADLGNLNIVWQLNYTLAFLSALIIANLRKVRSHVLAVAGSSLGVISLAFFATVGMVLFYELREGHILGTAEGYSSIAIRYISYVFAALMLYALYLTSRDDLFTDWISSSVLSIAHEAIAYTFIFITLSCELVNLMAQFHVQDSTKLGLSILWGIYALGLIAVGIARSKKHLRIAAIVLLAITLVKLFLYDIADLDTVPKTILFLTLGVTMLIVSFLYNKYKNFIFKPQTDQ